MLEKIREKTAFLHRIRVKNIVPFFIWPLLFLVAFFIMYNLMTSLYMDEIEYKGDAKADEISVNFLMYLNNVDDALKSSVAAIEYMMDQNAGDQEILDYITYESDRLGIVSATGSRGVFGWFRGKFLHGLGWDPGPDYDAKGRMWYKGALAKDGRYAFVGPYFNKRTDEYVVTAVKLLNDKESVICFAIDYETFKRMTTGYTATDEAMTILAMNEEGIVLANSSTDEIGVDYANSDDPLKRGIYNAIRTNGGKRTFTLSAGNGLDKSYVISRRHVMYDLYVVTVTDAELVLEPFTKAATVCGVILVLGIIIILVLNFHALGKDIQDGKRSENLNSIANIYASMYRIDMKHDLFEQITSMDYRMHQIIGDDVVSASTMMKMGVPQMVDERSRDLVSEFTNLDTLNDRMKYIDTITVEYLTYDHIWQRARFIAVNRDNDRNLQDVLFATEIIDDEKRDRERFKYLAETDQLTGINNRGSGQEKISDLLTKNVGGMFILFDVDKFKTINDTFGHDVGDEVLIAIGGTMQHTFRERDVIMRLGGDEFAAYMPSVFNPESGEQILNRFIRAIHGMHIPKLVDRQVEISIGAAFFYPTDTFSFDELYQRADTCAYESKKKTGSAITFYKQKDHEEITDF